MHGIGLYGFRYHFSALQGNITYHPYVKLNPSRANFVQRIWQECVLNMSVERHTFTVVSDTDNVSHFRL